MLRPVAASLRLAGAQGHAVCQALHRAYSAAAPEYVAASPPRPHEEHIRKSWLKRSDPACESAARLGTERVTLPPATGLSNEDWIHHGHATRLRVGAKLHGVHLDVFGNNRRPLEFNLGLAYPTGAAPVAGNVLLPAMLQEAPKILFGGKEGRRYTLLMTSPDDSIYSNDRESLHWMVVDLDHTGQGGRTVVPYLPPTPPRGTGYHRYVFTLLRQLDQAPADLPYKQYDTFSTEDFYLSHRMLLRGAAFFQCQWDESVTKVFTNTLGLAAEPNYSQDKYWAGEPVNQ